MFKKRREFLVNEEDVLKVITILNNHKIFENQSGNCGWAKAEKCWFVAFWCTRSVYIKILQSIAESDVTLLPETTGY